MAGDFVERIQILIDRVGGGEVIGDVEYNQIYAHRQEVEDSWNHPRGGQARYLSTALREFADEYWGLVAASFGADWNPIPGMIAATEALALNSSTLAPLMWGNLKGSAHPSVTHNGAVVYDRPPVVARLTDDELDVLHEEWHDLYPASDPWTPSTMGRVREAFGNPFRGTGA